MLAYAKHGRERGEDTENSPSRFIGFFMYYLTTTDYSVFCLGLNNTVSNKQEPFLSMTQQYKILTVKGMLFAPNRLRLCTQNTLLQSPIHLYTEQS